jgi:FAD/FMN-containing dehydrogenase
MESFPGAAVARAASGVCYGYFERAEDTAEWFARTKGMGWKAVIEFAPEGRKRSLELWPSPAGDFELMRRIKALFDPSNLLNRGRLYRRI